MYNCQGQQINNSHEAAVADLHARGAHVRLERLEEVESEGTVSGEPTAPSVESVAIEEARVSSDSATANETKVEEMPAPAPVRKGALS
jgi:hypothetical protein